MIITIPLDEKKENVCVVLGRAPYFFVYNTETGTSKIVDNAASDAPGGAGLQSAQAIVDLNTNVLITVRCGQNAAEVFEAAQMEIYKADGIDVMNNVQAFKEGKLEKLTSFHAGYHGKL